MDIDVRASLAGPREHALARTLSIVFVVGAVGLVPFARVPLPALPAVMGLCSGAAFVAFAATAYLLAVKARASRTPGVQALSATCAGAATLVALWGLTFPGAFEPLVVVLRVRPGSTPWLGLAWHCLAVAGVLAYRYRLPAPRRRDVVAAVMLFALIALYLPLPVLVVGGASSPLYAYGVAPLVVAAALVAAGVMGRASGTSLDPWLRAFSLAIACDLIASWSGTYRYTAGWYASRVFSVLAPLVLLCVLMRQIARLYGELASEAEFHKRNADTDALTGLASRRRFETDAALAVERAHRYGRPLSVAMIDVDRFKRYNDQFGHLAGDDALRLIGSILRAQLARPGDLVARYGGEEFVVLFDATDLAGAVAATDRVRSTLLLAGMPHPSAPAGVVSISAGVAELRPGETLLPLLDRADLLLYSAKHSGRDRVCSGEPVAVMA